MFCFINKDTWWKSDAVAGQTNPLSTFWPKNDGRIRFSVSRSVGHNDHFPVIVCFCCVSPVPLVRHYNLRMKIEHVTLKHGLPWCLCTGINKSISKLTTTYMSIHECPYIYSGNTRTHMFIDTHIYIYIHPNKYKTCKSTILYLLGNTSVYMNIPPSLSK